MQRKCVMKIGDNELFTKRSADMVTYSNTTVAQVLQNYDPASVPASTFGKKILACKNIDEFRNLLRVAKHRLYNESDDFQQLFLKGTPWLYTYNKPAFAKHSVACNADNRFNITLNLSNKFSVDFWLYSSTSTYTTGDYPIYFTLYNSATHYYTLRIANASTMQFVHHTSSSMMNMTLTSSLTANVLRHYQICTNNSKIYWFANGNLIGSGTALPGAGKWSFRFGTSASCWFSEVRVLDGVCEHTAKFSVPTEPYDFTPETAALLHFD